ncbi:hypothetical protein, partial [Desulfovibrio sp. SGI.169]|uniref:hypothetical protein n=1 Tax=Desulfovibrio sp. SGI.169 TaxID=3420561 RepID=UPI003D094E61
VIHTVNDAFYESILRNIKMLLKENGLFIFIDFKWLPKTLYRAEWNFSNIVHYIEDFNFKCVKRNHLSCFIERAIFINKK